MISSASPAEGTAGRRTVTRPPANAGNLQAARLSRAMPRPPRRTVRCRRAREDGGGSSPVKERGRSLRRRSGQSKNIEPTLPGDRMSRLDGRREEMLPPLLAGERTTRFHRREPWPAIRGGRIEDEEPSREGDAGLQDVPACSRPCRRARHRPVPARSAGENDVSANIGAGPLSAPADGRDHAASV
jgi:hypothetical protein